MKDKEFLPGDFVYVVSAWHPDGIRYGRLELGQYGHAKVVIDKHTTIHTSMSSVHKKFTSAKKHFLREYKRIKKRLDKSIDRDTANLNMLNTNLARLDQLEKF